VTLTVGGRARVHPKGPRITVMTRNLYLGTDIGRILTPADPNTPIPVLAAQAWGVVQQTNFPERAKAIADEIAKARPHLVGLQEVSLFRIQSPGDVLIGNPVKATEVAIDFLAVLLAELDARGLSYEAVAIADGIDIELPLYMGDSTPLADIRMTDREVILARSGVQIGTVRESQFQAKVPINVGGIPIEIPRAWASVEATVAGRTVQFISTHLERGAVEPIQRFQAGELLQIAAAETLPVILVGDFNSDADGKSTQTYSDITGAGFADLWDMLGYTDDGLTGSQLESLTNTPSALTKRVDLIFTRGADGLFPVRATVVGDEERDRTASGMWPSDHAGVVGVFRFAAEK
jgi:endonuclease/exonuclease/phosphatase family metal-dependent hydrolase